MTTSSPKQFDRFLGYKKQNNSAMSYTFNQSYDLDYCSYDPRLDEQTAQEIEEYENEMCYQADADRENRE